MNNSLPADDTSIFLIEIDSFPIDIDPFLIDIDPYLIDIEPSGSFTNFSESYHQNKKLGMLQTVFPASAECHRLLRLFYGFVCSLGRSTVRSNGLQMRREKFVTLT